MTPPEERPLLVRLLSQQGTAEAVSRSLASAWTAAAVADDGLVVDTDERIADWLGATVGIPSSEGTDARPWEASPAGQAWRGSVQVATCDGRALTAPCTILSLRGAPEPCPPYLMVTGGEDVAALAAEFTELARADKLASLGLMASAMAHEINNPVAGLIGCIEALEAGSVPAERRGEYFATIHDALRRIRYGVQSLLSYSRHGEGQDAAVDVHTLISDCLMLLSPSLRRRQIGVELELEQGALEAFGRRSELTQAILNLLLNAVHASPDGVPIRITGERDEGELTIRITDRGPGIPRDILPRICEPFFTTKPDGAGTGLGLAITRSIVEEHGGRLSFASETDRGTTVTVHLPRP